MENPRHHVVIGTTILVDIAPADSVGLTSPEYGQGFALTLKVIGRSEIEAVIGLWTSELEAAKEAKELVRFLETAGVSVAFGDSAWAAIVEDEKPK